uniref:Uncharacterized protein n=1 Tax=Arundo donax TaxID=35708 RepID=A0A0A9HSN8_ARUDO
MMTVLLREVSTHSPIK